MSASAPPSCPSCWILTDGRIGSENHSRGLAEALGIPYVVHPVSLRQPWKSLSPWLLRSVPACAFSAFPFLHPGQSWPDLLITTGRTPAVGALYVRRVSGGKTVCVQIMQAGVDPSAFDLLITPAHDRVSGPNVFTTTGALHRVTDDKLAVARTLWAETFAALGPASFLAGVLVGGSTKGLRLDTQVATERILPFLEAVTHRGGKVIATCSRRTDPATASLLRTTLRQQGGYCWDGTGENPYLGLLACADILAVTNDSVSLASEAAFTGKPVWSLTLPGHNPKLARFHRCMEDGGYLRPFTGSLPEGPVSAWTYPPAASPLRDTEDAARRVRELLKHRG